MDQVEQSIASLSKRLTELATLYKDTRAEKVAQLKAQGSATSIKESVGKGGKNNAADVTLVQNLLNKHGASLKADGDCGAKTIAAIENFQKTKLGFADGLISPGGKTWAALNAAPSSSGQTPPSNQGQTPPAQTPPSNSGQTPPSNQGQTPPAQTPPSNQGQTPPKQEEAGGSGDFTHPNASKVKITMGGNAVPLNARATKLLQSIVAACGMNSAHVTSTLRTYMDQARITKEQTLPGRGEGTVRQWYGEEVLQATKRLSVKDLAAWWEQHDKKRGKVSSKHLSGIALDVVPGGNRAIFAKKVEDLIKVSGSGVRRIIPKGVMNEPVDHVEFTFQVTNQKAGGSGGDANAINKPENTGGQTPANNGGQTPANTGQTPSGGSLSASVGKGGKNNPTDVTLVQNLLIKHGAAVKADGDCGPKTIAAIEAFQQAKLGFADGLISPGGKTWAALNAAPSSGGQTPPANNGQTPPANNGGQTPPKDAGLADLAKKFNLEVAVILAIQKVESGGNGYLPDGRPKILFEGHVFWSQLKKAGKNPEQFVKGNEDILYPKWDKSKYKGGAAEYPRLEKAIKIDRLAALKSASWGEYQIMGFNHAAAGYSDVESFVEAIKQKGNSNINALLGFLKTTGLLKHVQGSSKNWAAFAKGYNGPGYAKNKYDTKMAAAYESFKKQGY